MLCSGSSTLGMSIAESTGRHCVDIDGFRSRELTSEPKSQIQHIYVVVWKDIDLLSTDVSQQTCLALGEQAHSSRVAGNGQVPPRGAARTLATPPTAMLVFVHSFVKMSAVEALMCLELTLVLLQATTDRTQLSRIWFLTSSVPLTLTSGNICHEHAGVWGFARSAAQEISLPLLCVDFSGLLERRLLRIVQIPDEAEALVHGATTRGPRLALGPKTFTGRIQLQLHARGAISNLAVGQQAPFRSPPLDGQVEVAVRTIGLNFRDVLNVLGQYPGDPGPPGGD